MDTEFEDLVADSLRRRAGEVMIPPGLTGMAHRACRRHRHRQRAFRCALGAGAAAGTAAAIVAMSAGAPGMPPSHTTAYVVSRTEDALASSAVRSIQYVRVSWSSNTFVAIQPVSSADFSFAGPGYAANWYYGGVWQTAVVAANGKLAYNLGVIGRTSRTISLALVDYRGKTWQQFTVATTPGGASPQGCARAWPGLNGFTPSASVAWAEQVRHLLGCGLYAQAGREIVDGVDAIKLVPAGAERLPGVRATIWVNPSTYLPVRILTVTSSPRTWLHYDFRWLPVSRGTLATVHLRIPAGFRRSGPPQVIAPPPANAPRLHEGIFFGPGSG